jgi:pyruvate carboxylase
MYWEGVRRFYSPFESDIRAGTADVYRHEMPGGQYTNLREQARSLGLAHRWTEVSQTYSDVNRMFGDVTKVTPTSKVVGDMALMMVASDLSAADVMDPAREIAFPESVVSLFKGELGFPPDGFPAAMSRKVLKLAEGVAPPEPYRPGDRLPPVDLAAARALAEKECETAIDERQLSSHLMYPKVARDFHEHQRKFGDTSVLPTPVFFYGPQPQQEMAFEIDPGKTLLVVLQTVTPDGDATKVQFELNGQPRTVRVPRSDAAGKAQGRPLADPGNPLQVAAPMPGSIVSVAVQVGQKVGPGSTLLALEAMKMETHVTADREAVVDQVLVVPGDRVQAKELLIVLRALG